MGKILTRPQSSCAKVKSISYPESSGSLVSGLVAGRDSGVIEFLSHESLDSGFTAHA